MQNSTTIDQAFVGPSLQYDIYWKPVQNSKGIVDKYEFKISGTSANGTQIQFPTISSEHLATATNQFVVSNELTANLSVSGQTISSLNSTSMVDGIGIDWSDAVSAGYKIQYDSPNSSIDITIGKSFLVDPTTVATISNEISPSSADYYEGEHRIVQFGGYLYAFYFDGSNIVYRNSRDNGNTWSAATSLGTGAVASDRARWTMVSTTVSGTNYLDVLYSTVSGSTTNLNSIRIKINSDGTINSWTGANPILPAVTANSLCTAGGGSCTAFVAATDTSGNIFAAVRWLAGGASTYVYEFSKSADGGVTWDADGHQVSFYAKRSAMAMAQLPSGKMIFAYATYAGNEMCSRVFTPPPTGWGSVHCTTGATMLPNSAKQFSAASDTSSSPYIAFYAGGDNRVRVARFDSNGVFTNFEVPIASSVPCLPSITITPDGIVHLYIVQSGTIYEVAKRSGSWGVATQPFGTTFTSPDQLTTGISYDGGFWEETSGSQFNVRFGDDNLFGYQGVHPGGSYTDLTNVKGDIYTYMGNINSVNINQHIDRLVYLFDGNVFGPGFTVGAGYYDGTDSSGTEFYRYYYYVDDGAINDNFHILYNGIIPISPSWVTAEVVQGPPSTYNFYIGSTNIGSYTCSGTCTYASEAGVASWTSMSGNAHVTADFNNLYLKRDTDSSYVDWNSAAANGATHCNAAPAIYSKFTTPGNINEFQVDVTPGADCINGVNGFLYNEGAGG